MKYKKVIVPHFGGPEVLQLVDQDLPEPGSGQVRLKVLAAGISFADLLMREGVHPEVWFRRPPFTPGWDVLGVVDKCGQGVNGWRSGQYAAALPIKGGYAEYICLPQEEIIPVPVGLDPAEAICVVFNYATAYQMLHRSAKVRSGERVLIHSAAGGIGSALVELGKLAGLEMYGTASVPKHAMVAALGCTPIDYKSVDFVERLWQMTGDGVDAVFDGIGGAHLRRSYRTLRRGGRLIAYGLSATLAHGRPPPRVLAASLWEWLVTFGLNLIPDGRIVRLYSIQTLKRLHPAWLRQDLSVLFDLLSQRKIQPIVSERLSLEQAACAHERLASGETTGKLVITFWD